MSVTRIRKERARQARRQLGTVAVSSVALSAALLSGCSDQCLDNAAFYEQKVWTQVVSKNCLKCHAPEGAAAAKNSKFIQYSQAFPGFQDINLGNITEVAKIEYEGKSELLRKPLGEMNHGGGPVLDKGSEEYKILEEMVDRVTSPVTCGESGSPVVPKLIQMDPLQTLRKATLQLGGRLPNDAELNAVALGGEHALGLVLDMLMNEETFYTVLKEIYGDVMLTGRYNQYDGQALGLLSDSEYPGKYFWNPGMVPDNMLTAQQRNDRKWASYGIAAEPLELIAYVARNNKPFSEILTADYTVANYQSAQVYGVDPKSVGLNNPGNYYDFKPVNVAVVEKRVSAFPAASRAAGECQADLDALRGRCATSRSRPENIAAPHRTSRSRDACSSPAGGG